MVASGDVEIVNKLGLHARASPSFTQVASGFQCEVWLMRNGRRVNAKSIMGVMISRRARALRSPCRPRARRRGVRSPRWLKLIADKFDEGE